MLLRSVTTAIILLLFVNADAGHYHSPGGGRLDYRLKYAQNSAADLMAMAACIALYPVSQTYFDPAELVATGDANKDVPIVLVHGYLHNSSGMIMHRRKLNAAGFKNVYTVNLGMIPVSMGIEDFSEVLAKRIDEVLRQSQAKEVRLVGHSMGGLVCSYYALHIAANRGIKVKDVITLGSPLYGTKIASLGLGKCARQMEYESDFVKKLSSEIAASNIRFHHLASETDLIMRPYETSFNALKGDPSRRHLVDVGHFSYLFSKKVSQKMIAILSQDL